MPEEKMNGEMGEMMEEYHYTSSKGERIPVSKMQNTHLLNALLKMHGNWASTPADSTDEEHAEMKRGVDAMKAEILKRMPMMEGATE